MNFLEKFGPALITCFIGVFVLFAWLWFGRGYEITNYPPRGHRVIAFGDSLVSGVGASPGHDLVSLVAREAGVEIKNFGQSGDTTASALPRVAEVLADKPDIVMVLLGGNDALRRVPRAETERNLRTLINRFQESGAVVLLLGVRGGLLGDPYDAMYETIARTTGSAYVPDVLSGVFGHSNLMSDTIHPNDAGYALMAPRVAKALEKLLP